MKMVALNRLLILCYALSFSQVYAEQHTQVYDFIYQIKPGDTLSMIAKKMLDRPTRWHEVLRYNHLDNPKQIKPGLTLKIQALWLKKHAVPATVEALAGKVTVNGRSVKVGENLAQGSVLETALGANLRIRLPDGSIVKLLPQTQLQLQVMERNQAQIFKTVLALLRGQVEAFKKKYPVGQSDLSVGAKVATLGVRGTHFRMRQTADRNFAEIEQGLVSFESPASATALALGGGFGSVADGVHVPAAIALLPPPTLPQITTPLATPFIVWEIPKIAGAQAIVGELAQDDAFSKNLQSVSLQGNTVQLTDLANGHYWLKLRAVDAQGLQGMEGKVSFEINVLPPLMALVKAYVKRESIELRWLGRGERQRFQVQVANNVNFESPLFDQESEQLSAEIPRPASGQYYLRVRQIDQQRNADAWDSPVLFEVR